MSIGAAQVMTNVHRVRVGNKGIVVGVNVLSAAIARELQIAGIELHSMALPISNPVTKNHANPRHSNGWISTYCTFGTFSFSSFWK